MGARVKNVATDNGFSIKNMTKGRLPSLPFSDIKNAVLGQEYELSLVFAPSSLSHKLNKTYRDKDKPTNVLSFPLSKNSGEIFIDTTKAKTEAVKFNRNFKNYIGLLFIHGLFHLKGLDHGSTMDKEEEKIRALFNI
jgi:rRNA maturation RNase YbeY